MLVGFDIGGTKIEVRVLSDNGGEIFKLRRPTPDNYDEFLRCVCSMVTEVEQEVGAFSAIGIGLPGAVCPHTKLIKNANCTFLNGQDVPADLSRLTGKTVSVANDANCFALSEAVDGAGKGGDIVFGVIIGTGCGGGVVINQQALVGANAIAGEWGHNPLPGYEPHKDGETDVCYCGRHNCIEQFISGTGFATQFNRRHGTSLTSQQVMQKVEEGDEAAVGAYELLVDQMARSLAAVVNVLDPHAIVLGGGLSNVERLYQDLPKVIPDYIFSGEPKVNIKKAVYGDSSGVRGAAWLARG